jgi:hypothetical protein
MKQLILASCLVFLAIICSPIRIIKIITCKIDKIVSDFILDVMIENVDEKSASFITQMRKGASNG